MPGECSVCRGTRHVRHAGAWVRCECIASTLSTSYVHPTLRAGELTPPSAFTLLPLDQIFTTGGSAWAAFRHAAWGSLLRYEPRDITHDVVFFNRLSDIVTGREQTADDPESDAHMNVRDLVRLDVLILVISQYDIANRLTRSVLGNLLDEREQQRRGTWVFSHLTGQSLRSLLDEAIFSRWFRHLSDAHAPPAALGTPAHADRPGVDSGRQPANPTGGGATRWYRP